MINDDDAAAFERVLASPAAAEYRWDRARPTDGRASLCFNDAEDELTAFFEALAADALAHEPTLPFGTAVGRALRGAFALGYWYGDRGGNDDE